MKPLSISLLLAMIYGLWLSIASSALAAVESPSHNLLADTVIWSESTDKADDPPKPEPTQIPCCKRDKP